MKPCGICGALACDGQEAFCSAKCAIEFAESYKRKIDAALQYELEAMFPYSDAQFLKDCGIAPL